MPYQEYEIKDGQVVLGTDEGSKKWETFLNQLTWEEMVTAVQYGWYGRLGMESIGMSFQADTDGPSQLAGPYLWIVDRAPRRDRRRYLLDRRGNSGFHLERRTA